MRQLDHLHESLSERDMAILHDLDEFRLLTTRHIQRLHFGTGHRTSGAATRACTRVMARLKSHRLVDTLARRIGGVRQGSAGLTWQLDTTGDRLIRSLRADPKRRRFSQPSPTFIDHTLLITELAVQLRETAREQPTLDITALSAERRAWRRFIGRHGATEWLRPDLHIITTDPDFEQHWFVEADRGREHGPQLLRKCQTYLRYHRSGLYQAEHDLFPTVLWVVPDHRRARELSRIISSASLSADIFSITTTDSFINAVADTSGPEPVPLPGILTTPND